MYLNYFNINFIDKKYYQELKKLNHTLGKLLS